MIKATGWFSGGKVDSGEMDQRLNTLGRDGWELASGFDTSKLYWSVKVDFESCHCEEAEGRRGNLIVAILVKRGARPASPSTIITNRLEIDLVPLELRNPLR